jgi:para-aminobenzoate synthetase component 1
MSLNNLLEEARSFEFFCLLNPNQYKGGFPFVLATGDAAVLWDELPSSFQSDYFGFLSFDLKNKLFDGLKSENKDEQLFPSTTFFKAEKVWRSGSFIDDLEESIIDIPKVSFDAQVSKAAYVSTVNTIKEDILNGDVYELNYCISFVAHNIELDAVNLYKKLNSISPMPFSSLLKMKDCWLICASPERYIKKTGQEVISQPIKGTVKRGDTKNEDDLLIEELRNSEKERAENLMIVDLVRNDLNRCCKTKSVQVDELFGIYEFPQVHQMISTISGELKETENVQSLIEKTFPMGSMTGAPKLKSLELIEKYEDTKRGIFSGAVGYIDSNENADFNVVIRSLMYNEKTKTLSFMVGSAITYDCEPEKEYEECLLKASAIKKCFV